ncbi:MAG: hypothetical protein Q8P15_04140 [Nanoarchaeota archaeon]|nr:hypothetical protein [Nanoarchaeota archaeon]
MNKKIFLSKWHLIILFLALWIVLLGSIGCENFCYVIDTLPGEEFKGECPEPNFFQCSAHLIIIEEFWVVTLIGLIVLYLIIIFVSWLYYRKKAYQYQKELSPKHI